MKEPFALYRWCHKNGTKCVAWPRCGCDWYDNPTVTINGVRKRIWFHCEQTATSKELAYKLALANRQKYVRIAGQLEAPERAPAPLLSKYIDRVAPTRRGRGTEEDAEEPARLPRVREQPSARRDYRVPDRCVARIPDTALEEDRRHLE
jgi:hypothetical protein